MTTVIHANDDTEDNRMYDFLAIHFSKGQGKKALEFMRAIWMESAVADPSLVVNPELSAFFREGERNVVRSLENNIVSYNTNQKDKENK